MRGPTNPREFEEAVKSLISNARWNGVSIEAIRAILLAASVTAGGE